MEMLHAEVARGLQLRDRRAILAHCDQISIFLNKFSQDLKNEFHQQLQIPAIILRYILSFAPLKNRGVFFQINKSWNRLLSHSSSYEKRMCPIFQFIKKGRESLEWKHDRGKINFYSAFDLTFIADDFFHSVSHPKIKDSWMDFEVKQMYFAGDWIALVISDEIQFYQVMDGNCQKKKSFRIKYYDGSWGCLAPSGYFLLHLYTKQNYILWDIVDEKCTQTGEYRFGVVIECRANTKAFYMIVRQGNFDSGLYSNKICYLDIASGKSELFFALDEPYEYADNRAFCVNEDFVFVKDGVIKMIFIQTKAEPITFSMTNVDCMTWAQDSLFIVTHDQDIHRFIYEYA